MKENHSKLVMTILATILSLASCGQTSSESSSNSILIPETSSSISTPTPIAYEGFRVLGNENEEVYRSLNVFDAIIYASKKSKSSNKLSVISKDQVTVFKYNLGETFYLFKGEVYNKTVTSEAEAQRFINNNSDGYAINGKGTDYIGLGKKITPNAVAVPRGEELFSGSYSYLFSKKYTQLPNKLGYSYIKFTLEFSKAKLRYQKTTTEKGWNAYVFVNTMLDSPYNNCDIGIISNWEGNKGEWRPVFNFNGEMITPNKDDVITMMTYDEATDFYVGADDLEFEIFMSNNAYHFRVKNLKTNILYSYDLQNPKIAGNAAKSYLLLAASNCPVMENTSLWNPRNGARFDNVVYKDVKVAQFREDNNYNEATLIDFDFNNNTIDYLLVMGADCADFEMYLEGDTKKMRTSIYYDEKEETK